MDNRFQLALALSSLAFAACDDDSDRPPPAPTVTNLGLAVVDMTGDGDHWLLSVAEDGLDLNGDGDELDRVVHVLDLASGVVTSTSLDVTRPFGLPWDARVGGDVAAFAVSEAGQGGTDLNGDGDAEDGVLHVRERQSGVLRNTEISVAFLSFVDAGLVGFFVSEASEGLRDLDGDGDANDFVFHYHDVSAAETVNSGVSAIAPGQVPRLHDGFIVLPLTEAFAADDLNGDGDVFDLDVAHVHDTRTRSLENLMVATDSFGLFCGAGVLVLPVWEAAESEEDRNGDGDAVDVVIELHDLTSGTRQATGLTGPAPGTFVREGSSTERRVLLATGETDGVDKNGDGDLDDVLPALFEPATGHAFEPALAVDPFSANAPALLGELLAVAVSEEHQGLDLDGDGDLEDEILHLADPELGTVRNLRFPAVAGFQVLGGRLVVPRVESLDGRDWNGDGALDDAVPFLVEPSGTTLNTRAGTTGGALAGDGAHLLFLGREGLAGGGFRFEYLLYDVGERRAHRLGVRAGFTPRGGLGASGRAVVAVNEQAQGEDLNADGDLEDDVLHLVE